MSAPAGTRAPSNAAAAAPDRSTLRKRIEELGEWFHNLTLDGVQTAPHHFLGDYPSIKWRRFAASIPADLTGWTVLDVGCNAGFYSQEMKRRGAARVVAIDSDARYLAQARFAAEVAGLDIDFRQLSVYQVPALGERFDLVLFLGVLYHLRYPLLALDILHAYAVENLLVFQSMLRGSSDVEPLAADYPFEDTSPFDGPAFPRAYFVEHCYAGDPSNWWIPNRAAAEAMLRAAGFAVTDHPEAEVFVCRRLDVTSPHRPRPEELPWLKP
jgi:tRNA (mo5U34)-methyltransferase